MMRFRSIESNIKVHWWCKPETNTKARFIVHANKEGSNKEKNKRGKRFLQLDDFE